MRPKKTILCVDDNEQALSVRKFLLETRGYRVWPWPRPTKLWRSWSAPCPASIDLLLSDLLMPTMDGNELIRPREGYQPGAAFDAHLRHGEAV